MSGASKPLLTTRYGIAESWKLANAERAGAYQVAKRALTSIEPAKLKEEVKKATNGEGLQAVYDSVGLTTFDQSINCLARRGYMVFFGQSSGAPPPMSPGVLGARSMFLTRPGLGDYTATPRS